MRKAWTIEILLFLLYFSFGVSWLAYAPLLPDIETQFGVKHAQAAGLISIVSLAKAFVPLLAGLLAARIGLYRTLLAGAALASLSPLVPYAGGFEAMLGMRFLFGIGGAMLVTLTGAVVMQFFSRDQMPVINGLNNVAVNAGITTALYITVPVTRALGWQAGLARMGLFSLVLAVLWGILGASGPAPEFVKPVDEEALPLGSYLTEEANVPKSKASFMSVARMRETWLICLAFMGPLSLYLALNTWLPSHYVQAFGLTREDASQLTGLFNLVGIPTAILAGFLTRHLGLRRPLIIAAGLLMPPASLGLILSPHSSVRYASAIGLGISLFLYVSPLFTIPMELPNTSSAQVALMNGMVYSGAYLLASASPNLVGKMAESSGSYELGLCGFAVFSSVLAVAGWLLPETGKPPQELVVLPDKLL